jgi:hypothetical protein
MDSQVIKIYSSSNGIDVLRVKLGNLSA